MPFRLPVLLALSLALSPPLAHAGENYAQLLERVQAGDFDIDFRALRFAYARTPAYRPNSPATRETRQKLQAALERQAFTEAERIGDAWLTREYVNPFAHLGVARAFEALGATEKSRFHNRLAEALYDSICRAGEGRSADSPCPVISLDEEMFYLVRHQFEVGSQYEQVCADARPCHVYEVHEPNSDTLYDIHFDVTVPLEYQRAHAHPQATGTPRTP